MESKRNGKWGYRGQNERQQVEACIADHGKLLHREPGIMDQWGQNWTWSDASEQDLVDGAHMKTWAPELNDKGLRPNAGKVVKYGS